MRTNFWEPAKGLYGLFDVWWFEHLDVVLASGLGGGSLIYANVMLRKDENTFVKEDLHNRGYESWPVTREDLDDHYDNVQKLQNPTEYPYEKGEPYSLTPKTKAMFEAAQAMGLEAKLPKLAVAFSAPGNPLAGAIEEEDPNLHRAPRTTCRLCGECDIGCNYGSKDTLDFTYLSMAWRTGKARLRSCCEVYEIKPLDQRGPERYRVGYRQHVASRAGHPTHLLDPSKDKTGAVTAKHVVIAAGAIGTPRLLLKNRAWLRRLSPAVGTRFSANGDYFAWARDCREKNGDWRLLEPSRGPVITASIHVDEKRSNSGRGYYLQDAGAPAIADWFWGGVEVPGNLWRARGTVARRAFHRLRGKRDTHASGLLAALFGDAHRSAAMMPLLGMGRDVANGRLQLDGDQLQLDWRLEPSSDYYKSVRGSYEEFSRALGGKLLQDGLEWRKRAVTAHPVGGAAMSLDPSDGVVDKWGQVHGHRGLWIADGSVMPGPVGANPSFTIAALADRTAEKLIEEF
jgi:cholesterol oxidase